MIMPTHIVAAAGVVENNKGEVLLVRTPRAGWVFPGGQVEVGENLIEGLKREIMEESGINIEVGKLFAVSSNVAKYKGHSGVKVVPTKVMMDFMCTYVDGDLQISDETPEVAWIKKEEALEMIEAPAIIERFKAYLEFNGSPRYHSYVTKPEFQLKLSREI